MTTLVFGNRSFEEVQAMHSSNVICCTDVKAKQEAWCQDHVSVMVDGVSQPILQFFPGVLLN